MNLFLNLHLNFYFSYILCTNLVPGTLGLVCNSDGVKDSFAYLMNIILNFIGACAFGSLLSLACGIASYARTMRNTREDKARITWIGLALQAAWRSGTIVSRIFALLLCASVIHLWFLLAITVHWVGMTLWTIKQKTDLCTTAWEERIYNGFVGVIYCFCFFNIKIQAICNHF